MKIQHFALTALLSLNMLPMHAITAAKSINHSDSSSESSDSSESSSSRHGKSGCSKDDLKQCCRIIIRKLKQEISENITTQTDILLDTIEPLASKVCVLESKIDVLIDLVDNLN